MVIIDAIVCTNTDGGVFDYDRTDQLCAIEQNDEIMGEKKRRSTLKKQYNAYYMGNKTLA